MAMENLNPLTNDNAAKEALGGLAVVLASLASSFENEYVRGAVIIVAIGAWLYRAKIKADQASAKKK